jgi:hypothetical protein
MVADMYRRTICTVQPQREGGRELLANCLQEWTEVWLFDVMDLVVLLAESEKRAA